MWARLTSVPSVRSTQGRWGGRGGGSTKRRKSRVEELEQEVFDLGSRLGQSDEDPALWLVHREKDALRDLQLVGSRGGCVRLLIQIHTNLDCGSPFFYSLEKKQVTRQQLLTLLASDGSPVSDPEGIRGIARNYYTALFSPDPSSEDARRVVWEDLPQVILEGTDGLEAPINLGELAGALDSLSRGKAPGLDGLTVEFFRAYWNSLRNDYAGFLGEDYCNWGDAPFLTQGRHCPAAQ